MKILTVLTAPILVTASLLLMPAGDANAHRPGAHWQSGYADHFYNAPRHRVILPRWLRHNYDFRRWYNLNYRYGRRDDGWKRLYKRYQRDGRWHARGKHHKRRGHPGKRRYRGRHRDD